MLRPKIKNLLRAMQDRSQTASQVTAHNNLRKLMTAQECGAVGNLLRESPLYSHLSLPPEFPKAPPNFEKYIRLEPYNIENELTVLRLRVTRNFEAISKILSGLRAIDDSILAGELTLATEQMTAIYQEHGYSFALLRRISLVATISDPTHESHAFCIEHLRISGMERKNLILAILLDTLGENYEAFTIKRGVHAIKNRGKDNQFTRDIAHFIHTPFSETMEQKLSTLQSFSQYSLVDSVIYFCIQYLNIGSKPSSIREKAAVDLLSDTLSSTWKNLFIDQRADFRPHCKDDYMFYRRSITWIEHGEISQFRNAVDPYFSDHEMTADVARASSPDAAAYKTLYFSKIKTVQDLLVPSSGDPLRLDVYDPSHAGTFVRTIAFLYLLERTEGRSKATAEEFLELMDKTRDLPNIGNRLYLETFAKEEQDDLKSFIVTCLIARKSRRDSDTFVLRRLLQTILLSRFEGDLVKFLDFLERTAPAAADFVYELCDETFLSQLFRIYQETDDFFEARATLHDWYGKNRDQPTYAQRANALRVDLKLQKLRGEIDDTRIYVDPSRFIEWVHDRLFVEISSILRLKFAIAFNLLLREASAELPHQDTPERRLALVISDAYKEFCTNTIFGIASYLGRRIRHGTLKGVMASPVTTLRADSKFIQLFENEEFKHAYEAWYLNYVSGIDHIASEYLQVNSSKKPKGLLDTDIFRKDRADIVRAAMMEIINTYDKSQSYASVNALLYSYCWRMAELDLKRIREHVGNCRHSWGNVSELRKALPSAVEAIGRNFIRELGQLVDDRFRIVGSWFKQPTNLSPSAPLLLMFDAVMLEVKEAFADYHPVYDNTPKQEITLSGGAYQLVYDALYVVLYNAAKHGKKSGTLIYDFTTTGGGKSNPELIVFVSSEIRDDNTEEEVMENIKAALDGDIDDALVTEGKSGFRKLARMTKDKGEMTSVSIDVQNRCVTVTCRYALVY